MSEEGRIAPDGKSVIYQAPELEGVRVEVQYNVDSGKPFSPEFGWAGFGTVVLPTGQPRVVLQVKHADGTSLGVTFNRLDLAAFLECGVDAGAKAQEIANAADAARSRAS